MDNQNLEYNLRFKMIDDLKRMIEKAEQCEIGIATMFEELDEINNEYRKEVKEKVKDWNK